LKKKSKKKEAFLPEDYVFDIQVGEEECTIVTHALPHADEVGISLILDVVGRRESEKIVEFFTQFAPNKVLKIGIGGGRWDEHSSPYVDDKKLGESAISLFARDMGIQDSPEWRNVLNFINLNDTKGSRNARDIATLLNVMNFQNPYNPDSSVNWFLDGLRVKFYLDNDNKDFTIDRIKEVMQSNDIESFDCCCADFKGFEDWYRRGDMAFANHKKMLEFAKRKIKVLQRKKEVYTDKVKCKGKTYFLASIIEKKNGSEVFQKTENYRAGVALRRACKPDLMMVKNAFGHLMVSMSKRLPRNYRRNIVSILRVLEREKKKNNGSNFRQNSTFKQLGQGGVVREAEEWFYHEDLGMIFNGTLTHPGIKKTALDFSEIIKGIKIGLENPLKSICEKECTKRKCNLYKFGLSDCRRARFNLMKEREMVKN